MSQVPLVSVFIDGLKPEWVGHMPFVRSIAPAQRLRTILGYSIACHATMYTGLSPREHGLWFVWCHDDDRSPFRPDLFRRVPRIVDSIPSRLLARKLALSKLSTWPGGYFGVPRIVNLPMSVWPGLWVSEEKFWTEDGYTTGGPTIFELARTSGIRYRTIGLQHGGGHLNSVRNARVERAEDLDWLYLFFGEVDHAAHLGNTGELQHTLRAVDATIEARCKEVEAVWGGFDFMLFSDHGHATVERYVDFYQRLRKVPLRRIRHVVDTNYARFWFDSDADERLIRAALEASIPEGWALTPEELTRWEVDMPDRRYGDLIFYLDIPCAFKKTIWGFSRSQRSIHGYLPSHPDMDGTLVTTLAVPVQPQLADVFGLHARRLGVLSAIGGAQ